MKNIIMLAVVLSAIATRAQLFVKKTNSGINQPFVSGDFAWMDFTNDGLIDNLGSGYNSMLSPSISRFSQVSSGVFIEQPFQYPNIGFVNLSMKAADFDADNRVDFCGLGKLYFNPLVPENFTGVVQWDPLIKEFNLKSSGDMIKLSDGSVDAGDFNNDGHLDLAIMGRDITNKPYSIVYSYDTASGRYIDAKIGLMNLWGGTIRWIDIDNDGDLDLFLCGITSDYITNAFFYINNRGIFTKTTLGIDKVALQCDFADIDNDGDWDLFTSGIDFATKDANDKIASTATLYRNDPTGFVKIGQYPGLIYGQCHFGDFDNDGDPDLVNQGIDIADTNKLKTLIYENVNSTLTRTRDSIPGAWQSALKWADVDNDGDLDFYMSGSDTVDSWKSFKPFEPRTIKTFRPVSGLYVNQGTFANTTPTAPRGLRYRALAGSVKISWDKPLNFGTNYGGTYNIAIGKKGSKTFDIVSPLSFDNGSRKIVEPGNCGLLTNITINLPAGQYVAKVQAIDWAFEGGSFSETIEINVPFDNQQILYTTFDTTRTHYKIIWHNTPGFKTKYYIIYSHVKGDFAYDSIGTAPYGDTSFVDKNMVAQERLAKYKIVAVDSLGNKSAMSGYHQPIFLKAEDEVNGLDTTKVLTWTRYEGVEDVEYYVFKGSSPNKLIKYASVPPTKSMMYRDVNYNVKQHPYYLVEAYLNLGNPQNLKSSSGPYSLSLSNMAESKLLDLPHVENHHAGVIPNPSSGLITVVLGGNYPGGDLTIYNALGETILSMPITNPSNGTIPVATQLAPGFYTVSYKTPLSVHTGTCIVK